MPSPFYELSRRFGLRRLLGTSSVHDIGTGFQSLGADVDGINQGHQDFLQAGAVSSADWALVAAVNAGTGELSTVGETGGTAWLPDPILAGALMRTVTALAKLNALKPPSLPAAGKYMSVGIQLSPQAEGGWDAGATGSVVSGAEKASQAEAEAAPAGAVAGHVRIRDVVIHNLGGFYSIAAQRDRRPWARGYFDTQAVGFIAELTGTAYEAINGNLSQRVECSGAVLRLRLQIALAVPIAGGEESLSLRFVEDGVEVGEAQAYQIVEGAHFWIIVETVFTPVAGSHLFVPQYHLNAGGAHRAQLNGLRFTVEEILRPNANNGTT